MKVLAASRDVVDFVERDGMRSAELHGANVKPQAAELGDRIVSNVPLPAEAISVTDDDGVRLSYSAGTLPFSVQAVRWRSRGWAAEVHRVVQFADPTRRTSQIVAASPWTSGAWGGESLLTRAFDPALPARERRRVD